MTGRTVRFAHMVAWTGVAAGMVRGVALLKELAVASRFGTGDSLDAFLLAISVPLFVSGALRAAVQSSLAPRLIAERRRLGEGPPDRYLASALGRHVVLCAGAAVALAALGGPLTGLVASGFPAEKREIVERVFLLLCPLVLLDGVATVWTTALQAEGRVFAATIGLAGSPVVTLAAVLALGGASPLPLVVGAVAGPVAEALWAGSLLAAKGYAPWRPAAPFSAGSRAPMAGFARLLLASAVVSLNPIVDNAMVAYVGAGSVAALGYGLRLPAGVLGLVAVALGTPALPRYSSYVVDGDARGLRRAFTRDASFAAIVGTAIAAVIALLSTPLTRWIFQRGAFSPDDTAVVAFIQACSATQIPSYLVGILAARALNAARRDWEIVAISGGGVIVNVAGNLLLAPLLGAAGIALSTGIVYAFTACLLAVAVVRALRRLETPA